MNDDLWKNPFDEEYKALIEEFSKLLQTIIETVDKYGLKKRHLRKHKEQVEKFFKNHITTAEYQSQIAVDYQKKLGKYQNQLFTFLDFDGIPWNNNNAEHTIKAFAMNRKLTDGFRTEKGMREFLVLFSIYQTCVYKEIDFLKFLRSGETDIDKFNSNKH